MQPEDTPRAAPQVVVVYGQANENQMLADELALDGFDVRLVYDLALLGEVRSGRLCSPVEERCGA
jgi:hypothetical protein